MIRFSIALGLIAIFLNWSSAVSQQVAAEEKTTARVGCEPVGRVLSEGLLNFTAGSLVCEGDRLQVANGATANLLCFPSGQVLTLTNTHLASICGQTVNKKRGPCAATRRSDCIKPKGPSQGNNTPTLITPYGNTLLENRPLLSWVTVPEADTYVVEIGNKNGSWQQTVKTGTRLLYPPDKPAMQQGRAYKVTITAMRGDSVISASEKVLNLLNKKDALLVRAEVERVNRLELSKDEAVYLDLNSIYSSRNLINDAIETLSARVRAGSQSPAIYRTLADRYLEAGLPDYAKRQYEMASNLAQKTDNWSELAKAQAGLKAVQVALLNNDQNRHHGKAWDDNQKIAN